MGEEHGRVIVRQLLQTLKVLHMYNICHRDIKPENVILTLESKTSLQQSQSKEELWKFIDFGESCKVELDQIYNEFLGTACYLAPERWREHYGWELKASDMWAVGVLTFELLCGKRCFRSTKEHDVQYHVAHGKWNFPEDIQLSPLVKDFITTLLNLDPSKRPCPEHALQHPWLIDVCPSQYINPICRCHKPSSSTLSCENVI